MKPAEAVFWPFSVIWGHVPETGFSGIPGQFCQKCRLAPPESWLFPEMATFPGKEHVSRHHFPARSGSWSARAELKS